jgi:hypothetical protein
MAQQPCLPPSRSPPAGKVRAAHKKRRRRKEFLDFMDEIVADYPFPLVTVEMDYGFALVPVTMLFLYHSVPVTIRFTLLDNRAVAIPITIMAFANTHASAYRTNSNSNIVRQSWRRNGSYGSNHQNVLHSNFLHCEP